MVIDHLALVLDRLLASKLTKALLVSEVKVIESQLNHWAEDSVAYYASAQFNLIVAVRVLHGSDDLYSPTSNNCARIAGTLCSSSLLHRQGFRNACSAPTLIRLRRDAGYQSP